MLVFELRRLDDPAVLTGQLTLLALPHLEGRALRAAAPSGAA
jgi:hypothetical protein